MAQVDGGWHFRDVLTLVGVFWAVFVVGLGGLVFRVGKVIQQHQDLRDLLLEVRGELKAMQASSKECGEKRDKEREALRLELKADIQGLHARVDEVMKKGNG